MAKRKKTKKQTVIYKTLNKTKNRGWTHVLRNGKSFVLY